MAFEPDVEDEFCGMYGFAGSSSRDGALALLESVDAPDVSVLANVELLPATLNGSVAFEDLNVEDCAARESDATGPVPS